MKMHNSSEIQYQKEKSFVIRYQEPILQSPKKRKGRYSNTTEPIGSRSLIASEADIYGKDHLPATGRDIQLLQTNSSRPKRKQMARMPTKLLGSMIEIMPDQRSGGEEKQQKDFAKIPIEYNDEKAHGNLADFFRLKVVYRGYAPKNTYFFLKSLAISSIEQKGSKRGEYDLQFNSRFQSGNLASAAKKGLREYWLFMREDTNTFGLRQWFYFEVKNRKPGKYRFRIYKYSKNYSLYRQGMKPFIRNDSTETQWKQGGQNVKYECESEIKCNYLEFQYIFETSEMKTQFASQPPYTYTMLKQYIQSLAFDNSDIQIRKAGESLAGLEIPLIKVIESNRTKEKSAIIIMARTHPSEVASNYALQGFLERLQQLPQLKTAFDFYIIPMVNPDGVFFGNHRTGVMGQDLNRNFNSSEQQLFPEIKTIQKLIQKVKANQRVEYLLDLHGHSAKRNIFAYGDDHPIGSFPFAFTHILPKLLSEQISTFKYDYCVFRQSKEKKNTARVYLSRRYRVNAITFEESYGLIDEGAISIRHWRNFGIALADSLLEYHKIYAEGKQEAILGYLSEQIKYQQEAYERRQKRKVKKLQLQKQMSQSVNLEKVNSQSSMDLNIEDSKKTRVKTRQAYKDQEKQKYMQKTITEVSEDTINQSLLSSGDEELENNEEGMQLLKKQLLKIGCLKDGARRQTYNIPQKKIQIKGFYQPIIHQQRGSMASRILKFQMKKKDDLSYFNFNKLHQKQENNKQKRKSLSITQKSERESIQLPYLRR